MNVKMSLGGKTIQTLRARIKELEAENAGKLK